MRRAAAVSLRRASNGVSYIVLYTRRASNGVSYIDYILIVYSTLYCIHTRHAADGPPSACSAAAAASSGGSGVLQLVVCCYVLHLVVMLLSLAPFVKWLLSV